MAKYFLICASRDHVLKGVTGGFAQAGHGRKDLISKPSKGDWLVFYSSKDKFENGIPLQKFTALGQVVDEEPYQPNTRDNFKPYRRNVKFKNSQEVEIRPLLARLTFIKNKKEWGFYFISGFREIAKEDFDIIKNAMK
ncbi:MAG: EVE domain-containing protein [Chitinophagales bacterium]|nr:EVE domain-containing protein [Chitinophagales bacterium]